MNRRTFILSIVIFDFFLLTAYTVMEVGYLGILDAALLNWGTIQIFTDLVIACSLAIVWMVIDSRERGLNPWPFVIITLALGSFGPLFYLLVREWNSNKVSVPQSQGA